MVLYSQQLCCECVCHTNDKLTHHALHMCECMAADFIGMRRCRRANQFDSPTVIRIFSWYMCHTHLKIQKKISISLISVSLYLTDLNIKYFFAYFQKYFKYYTLRTEVQIYTLFRHIFNFTQS